MRTRKQRETVAASSLANFARTGVRKTAARLKKLYDRTEEVQAAGTFSLLEVQDEEGKDPSARVGLIQEGPGNKKSNYYYTGNILKEAVAAGIFENASTGGKQSYINHPSRTQKFDRPERDVSELAGFFSDVKYETFPNKEAVPGIPVGAPRGMVTATFHPESGNTHVMSKLREAAKFNKMYPDAPGYFGFSIVAGGKSEKQTIEGKEFNVVTKLSEIDSIDMVTRAGAGGRLLSFQEGYMGLRSLFGGGGRRLSESQRHKEKVGEIRESIADHIIESLDKIKVETTNKQDSVIKEALAVLPSALMTPAFVATVLMEANIDVPDDKMKLFESELGFKEGKMEDLITEMDDEEAEVETKEKKEAASGGSGSGKTAKAKKDDDDDMDDEEADDKKKESAVVRLLKNQLKEAQTENGKLTEKLTEASVKSETATQQLRRVSADRLLSKSKLSEAKKTFILDSLLEVEPKEQLKVLAKFEEAFGDKDSSAAGAPGRQIREATTGNVVSFNAMK